MPNQLAQSVLFGVPKVAETRISSLMSSLTQQRDTANNASANLAAEIEVYRHAADHYQQQSLGLQAQIAMIQNDYAILVEARDRLWEKTEMMASDVIAASGERDSAKSALTSVIAYIESASNLKECRTKVTTFIDTLLQSDLDCSEVSSDNEVVVL
jgi:uncharacterized coiled-coil DUF342 family protein